MSVVRAGMVWMTAFVGATPAACASAQHQTDSSVEAGVERLAGAAARPQFRSASDSLAWARTRDAAARARGFRVVVSLFDRRLWTIRGPDTLLTATVAVGMDSILRFGKKAWDFETPRGRRVVESKDKDPVWVPPDWHYVEAAQHHGLRLERLVRGRPVTLADGQKLEVRGDIVQLVATDGTRTPLPIGDEIIFDGVLYAPPLDTRNRRIAGELGRYRLDLGGGILLHGTPDVESIGLAATHGCIRLGDDDIEWLFTHVPVGTSVYIY